MRLIVFPLALLTLIITACGSSEEEPEQTTYEILEEIQEENNEKLEFVEKAAPEEGSTKDMILGTWDPSNSDVKIEITKDRYYTYDGDTKVWDQDWELTTDSEFTIGTYDDNGTFIHVINDEGESYYSIELIDVEDGRYTGYVNGAPDVVEYIKM
jgi:hypothetical protein